VHFVQKVIKEMALLYSLQLLIFIKSLELLFSEIIPSTSQQIISIPPDIEINYGNRLIKAKKLCYLNAHWLFARYP